MQQSDRELARQFGVPTPAVDTVIQLASIVLDTDFRAQGLPADRFHQELFQMR